jgi:phosphate transport system substrate-binding protein
MTKQYECLNPDCPIYKRGENFDHPSCYDCPYKVINLSSINSLEDTSENFNESEKIKSEFATFKDSKLSPLNIKKIGSLPKLISTILIPLLIIIITGAFLYFSVFSESDNTESNNSVSLMKDKETELVSTISGSSTIGKKLMPELIKSYLANIGGTNVTERFNTETNQLSIYFNLSTKEKLQEIRILSGGSSSSFENIENGTCDIGMSSRKIFEEENSKIVKADIDNLAGTDNEMVIGLDGVSIIINNSNKVNELTKDEIKKIFTGEITDWADLGGNSGKINLYTRNEDSGSLDFFQVAMLDGDKISKKATIIEHNDELSSKIAEDENGIGFVGMGYIGSAKPLSLASNKDSEYFLPTPFNISTESYILSRRLYIYAPPKNLNEFSSGFIAYLNSDDAQDTVTNCDFISNNIFELSVVQITKKSWSNSKLESTYNSIIGQAESRLSVDIRFEFEKSTLDEKSIDDLNRIVDFLNKSKYLNYNIALLGFTDSIGNKNDNIELSKTRAEFVKDELVKLNPSLKDRIITNGFADEQPIASNKTDVGKNKNRRVEIWLIKN